MKLVDIVTQLRTKLPKYTTLFSNIIPVSSIDATNNIAIINTTSDHELSTGDEITLTGYNMRTSISSVSQDGLLFTFTTSTDHDLTEVHHEEVTLQGFDSTDWNGDFTLIEVPNRRNFVVRSLNDIPVLTGDEYLLEERIDGLNGKYTITVIDSDTLSITGDFLDRTYQDGVLNAVVRIVGDVMFDHFLEQYTEHNQSELTICVVMHDSFTSNDTHTHIDAIAAPVNGVDIRLSLINGFSIFIIGDTSRYGGAQTIIDICGHTLLRPILRSVYGVKFSSGLYQEYIHRTIYTGGGVAFYDRSVYAHVHKFQMVTVLTEDDAADESPTRAYRDTDLTIESDIGDDEATVIIDQDDEPLDRSY